MTKPNLSLNGIPGTLWEIRRQENIHPYLGLRQACLTINAQEKALKEGRLAQKKLQLKLEVKLKESINTDVEELEKEIFQDEIDLAKYDLNAYEQLILDAETELRVASEEKKRIELLNPSFIEETYESLQAKYANEAFQRKLARAVIISASSHRMMISEGAAEVIYDSACLSEDERQRFELYVFGSSTSILPQASSNLQQSITTGGLNGSGIK